MKKFSSFESYEKWTETRLTMASRSLVETPARASRETVERMVINMRYSDLSANPEYYVHHTAFARGYVSTKCTNPLAVEYSGRFGKGYIALVNGGCSTRFCTKIYYIKRGTEND